MNFQPDFARLKTRMEWTMPWYTVTDEFDADFGVDEWHGTNAFIRDGERVFRTYFVNNCGDEALGSSWSYLDLTALGRQEDWEDSDSCLPARQVYSSDKVRKPRHPAPFTEPVLTQRGSPGHPLVSEIASAKVSFGALPGRHRQAHRLAFAMEAMRWHGAGEVRRSRAG